MLGSFIWQEIVLDAQRIVDQTLESPKHKILQQRLRGSLWESCPCLVSCSKVTDKPSGKTKLLPRVMKRTMKSKAKQSQNRAHDVLPTEAHPLDPIFMPRTVAVVGASERLGSVGRAVLWSLVSSPFGGTVYPVN